jgi:hypothetical protein
VLLQMKSNQICTKHAFEQLCPEWTYAKGLRIWPRNMPEEPDLQVGALSPKHAWNESHLIVLH